MDKNEKNSRKDTKQISVKVFNYYPLELGGGGETFSISIIEGLMSGVPVLATGVSGPKEIISQDKNFGDILDFNANLFVSKILEYYDLLHRDKEKYYERRLKIRESSLKLFDIKNAIDGYSNMIKEILEE